jgi:predicted small secreted protein
MRRHRTALAPFALVCAAVAVAGCESDTTSRIGGSASR